MRFIRLSFLQKISLCLVFVKYLIRKIFLLPFCRHSEAAFHRCSSKNVSLKICNIHRKVPTLEFLFNFVKVTEQKVTPQLFLQKTSGGCFWTLLLLLLYFLFCWQRKRIVGIFYPNGLYSLFKVSKNSSQYSCPGLKFR